MSSGVGDYFENISQGRYTDAMGRELSNRTGPGTVIIREDVEVLAVTAVAALLAAFGYTAMRTWLKAKHVEHGADDGGALALGTSADPS